MQRLFCRNVLKQNDICFRKPLQAADTEPIVQYLDATEPSKDSRVAVSWAVSGRFSFLSFGRGWPGCLRPPKMASIMASDSWSLSEPCPARRRKIMGP